MERKWWVGEKKVTWDIDSIVPLVHVRASSGDKVSVHVISGHFSEQISHVMSDPSSAHLVKEAL